MDRERPLGAADRDVDLHGAHELPGRHAPVLGDRAVVARPGVELALLGRERVQPGPCEQDVAADPGGEVQTAAGERRDRLPDRRGRPDDDLEVRRGQLEREARVATEAAEQLDAARREVERRRIEEHDLLLDPDRRRGRLVEGRA